MDLDATVKSNEKEFFGKKYLYIPLKESEKLLVVLSAHNQGSRYFLLRSFFNQQRHNLLFITNPKNNWYLDDDYGKTYLDLIQSFAQSFDKKNVFIFGSSMAGYAAINFAVRLNVNCLTCNPQVNLELSMDYGWSDLNRNIANLVSEKKSIPLETLLNQSVFYGVICIIHGHNPIDVANVELILGSSTSVRKLLVYTLDTDDHAMPFGRDVEKVYEVLELIAKFNSFNLDLQDASGISTVLRENRKEMIQKGAKFPHRFLSNFYKPSESTWRLRHKLKRPGAYFFEDVGYYNSAGQISGALIIYDGDQYYPISGKVHPHKKKSINFSGSLDLSNNQIVKPNVWVRVPDDGKLFLKEGIFHAVCADSKNCYINWDLRNEVSKIELYVGMYVSCLLDIEVSDGNITFSIGAFGQSGYYQVNKTITSSGRYTITFQIQSINLKHSHSLFSRVYFFPDGKEKNVTIRALYFSPGNFPLESFFNFE